MKQQPLFVWRLHENKAPSTGKVRGYRIKVAVGNLNGYHPQFGNVPSFAPKYMIGQSGDYPTADIAESHLDEYLRTLAFKRVDPARVIFHKYY